MLPMRLECSSFPSHRLLRMRRMVITLACWWAGCLPLVLAATPPVIPAPTSPAWVGEMASARVLRFALEGVAGEAPRWLGVGDSCDGYVVLRYEAHPETLTLRHGADTVTLTLRNGAVAPAPATAAPAAPAHAGEIAAAEVRKRDGWGSAITCEPAQRHGDQWWILVKHAPAGRSEARMVILSDDGRVLDYWRV